MSVFGEWMNEDGRREESCWSHGEKEVAAGFNPASIYWLPSPLFKSVFLPTPWLFLCWGSTEDTATGSWGPRPRRKTCRQF